MLTKTTKKITVISWYIIYVRVRQKTTHPRDSLGVLKNVGKLHFSKIK